MRRSGSHNRAWRVVAVSMLGAGVVLGGACGDDAGESTTTRPGGTVSVVVSDLEGHEGDQLAGVLLERGEGVAGFVTTVDADPFSSVIVLGDGTCGPATS